MKGTEIHIARTNDLASYIHPPDIQSLLFAIQQGGPNLSKINPVKVTLLTNIMLSLCGPLIFGV